MRIRQPPYPIAENRFQKDHKTKKDSLQIPLTNYKTKKQTKYNLQNCSVRIRTVISMAGKITRKWIDESYCLSIFSFFCSPFLCFVKLHKIRFGFPLSQMKI